jgi:hypothetical protein
MRQDVRAVPDEAGAPLIGIFRPRKRTIGSLAPACHSRICQGRREVHRTSSCSPCRASPAGVGDEPGPRYTTSGALIASIQAFTERPHAGFVAPSKRDALVAQTDSVGRLVGSLGKLRDKRCSSVIRLTPCRWKISVTLEKGLGTTGPVSPFSHRRTRPSQVSPRRSLSRVRHGSRGEYASAGKTQMMERSMSGTTSMAELKGTPLAVSTWASSILAPAGKPKVLT